MRVKLIQGPWIRGSELHKKGDVVEVTQAEYEAHTKRWPGCMEVIPEPKKKTDAE